jgi:2-keto-4-pentenoate hydratase/2-oxohepta-3-ene-1,7-dioic acid hydratase in catechol pathway
MRWVTYDGGGSDRLGLIVGDQIHGLEPGPTLMDLLGDDGTRLREAGERATDSPADVRPLEGAVLRAPLKPTSMRDFLCFLQHLRNCRAGLGTPLDEAWEQIPAFYFTNPAAVIGPHDKVAIAPGSERFDFELEVAAVVGRGGSDLDPETAADHIAGYTIFCDWSARDLQVHEMKLGLGPAKGKDSATTLGPAFVTADELAPFASGNSFKLDMRVYVNDEEVGGGSMDQMDWSWGEVLAYASRGTTLNPGDVIGSGTVPTGCLFEHFSLSGGDGFRGWLEPGDRVRLWIEQIGEIENEVVAGPPVHRLRTGF